MSWKDLLSADEPATHVLPWAGGRQVHSASRSWKLKGRLPLEHGWYSFSEEGARKVRLPDREMLPAEPDFTPRVLRGYVVGDRFIEDGSHVDPDPAKLIAQTEEVFCVERGLERFTRATVFRDREGRLIYLQQQWPEGAEQEALEAYQDRKTTLEDIKGVTPELDLAFQWIVWGRAMAEERARQEEIIRKEELARMEKEERLRQIMKDADHAPGLRALAKVDFEAAARRALAFSNSELLDVRDGVARHEKIVQYRFRHRRLECIVHAETLRVIDAGVCLDDHRGTKGDTRFTLESLPGVIGEAMDHHRLVVWRHVDGDEDY